MNRVVALIVLSFVTVGAFYLVNFMGANNYSPNHISLSITIIGTLLGVLYALFTNDIYQYYRDRSQLSKLYLVVEKELENKIEELGEQIRFTSARNSFPIEEIELPKIIDNLYADVTFHRLFSPTMRNIMYHGSYTSYLKPILYVLDICRKEKKSDDFIKYATIVYSQLDLYRRFIVVERQYLLGLISASETSKLWIKFKNEAEQQRKVMEKQKWRYTHNNNSISFSLDESNETT